VKIAIRLITVSFSEILSEVLEKRRAPNEAVEEAAEAKNKLFEVADTILDMMTEPVLARINRALAG
jgi:predicted CopG family antitoxin